MADAADLPVAGEEAWRQALRAELQLFLRQGVLGEFRAELRSLVQEALQGCTALAVPPALSRAVSPPRSIPGPPSMLRGSSVADLPATRPRAQPIDLPTGLSRQTSPLERAISADGGAAALSAEEDEASAALQEPWRRHPRKAKSTLNSGGGGGGGELRSVSPRRISADRGHRSSPLGVQSGTARNGDHLGAAKTATQHSGSLHHPLLEDEKFIRPSRKYAAVSAKALQRSSFRGRSRASRLVDSEAFSYGISVVIIINAVLIGIQTDYMAQNATISVPPIFNISELIFCVLFTFELILRIFAHGLDFFFGPEAAWNRFDAFVILAQLFEQSGEAVMLFETGHLDLHLSEYTDDTGILRILRIFRLMRILRLLRVVHLNGELQAIVAAIGKGMRSFYWTVALLVLLMYAVGVFITQSVTDHKVALNLSGQASSKDLQEFYGSLSSTMLALFQAISDGEEWRSMLHPLEEHLSPWFAVLFCMYIAFVAFALMNILTGIFVDRALQSGQEEKRRFLLQEVQAVFLDGDTAQDGQITWPEFQAQLQNPHMQQLFEALDVDEEDASELFHILDSHHSGAIEAEEFVNGCLRLDGPAKAVDLAAFTEEYRRLSRGLLAHTRFVNGGLLRILTAVEGVAGYGQPSAPGSVKDAADDPAQG